MKRYEQYAGEIAELIRTHALRPGDRLPSGRQAVAGRGTSRCTVSKASYLLEARGLTKSRPRWGYYVNATARRQQAEPVVAAPLQRSLDVEISDLVFQVLGSTRQRDVVPLGSA